MCLAQGYNAVTLVRLEPVALRSRVKHSTTEPLRSLQSKVYVLDMKSTSTVVQTKSFANYERNASENVVC